MGQSVAVLSQYFILTGEERVKILQRKLLSYLSSSWVRESNAVTPSYCFTL